VDLDMGVQGVDWIYLNMTAFWDIAPCNVVEVDRRFRGAFYLHHQVQDRLRWRALVNMIMNLLAPYKARNLLIS
jgi:hypothetical protein